ncbi:MAG: hypothetical protein LBR40_05905 [Bacilli bacterium]|jgi:hypothetical protein|nr:hypothetical protein [Bacilli bacterium]
MRNKLLVILLLLLLSILLIQNDLGNKVFVKNITKIVTVNDKGFKKSDLLILGVNSFKTGDVSGIVKKYSFSDAKNANYCGLTNSSKVYRSGNDDIILVQDGSNISYYKERDSKCNEIFKRNDFELIFDTNTVYANNSIYTSIESNTDFTHTGMSRVSKDDLVTYDNLNDQYTNPIVDGDNVIMIQNLQSVVSFNKNNKMKVLQNNDENVRRVIAINNLGKGLFMIVKTNNTYVIEGYNINDKNSITKIKPIIKYDVSAYFKNYSLENSEINIYKNDSFVVFNNGSSTIFIKPDFSKIITYANSESLVSLIDDKAILVNNGIYFVLDLTNNLREDIGNLRAFSVMSSNNDVYFGIIDNKQKEVYLKFTLK